MPRKTLITSPVPSIEETAREIGLSAKRARQIAALMDDIVQRRLRRAARITRHKRATNAARNVASRRVARTRTRTSHA